MILADVDELDLYAGQEKGNLKIQAVLDACLTDGIYQIHAEGYDFKLNECELIYKSVASRSAHILGLEEAELPKRWHLSHKRRKIDIDMSALKKALKNAYRTREEDDL